IDRDAGIGRNSLVSVNAGVGDRASLATRAVDGSGARVGDHSVVEFLGAVRRGASVGVGSGDGAHDTVGQCRDIGYRSSGVDDGRVGAHVRAGDDVVTGQRARIDDGVAIGDGAVVWGHITSDVAPGEVRRDDQVFDGLTASREELAFGSQGGWLRTRY